VLAKEAAMAKLFASQVAERVTSLAIRNLRWLWIHERLSGRKILVRFEDWQDLRRHVKYAAGDHCQAGDGKV